MKVLRIVSRKRQSSALGEGSQLVGGRWNPIGTTVIYTTTNFSDAVRQLTIHLGDAVLRRLSEYICVSFDLDKISYRGLTSQEFADFCAPADISDMSVSQSIGRRWLTEQDTCALIVPSRYLQRMNHVVINPLHPEFSQIAIGEFESLSNEGSSPTYDWYGYVDVKGTGRFEALTKIGKSRPPFHVFVSHASKDKTAIVQPLSEALKSKGLQVWLDDDQLLWSDSVPRGIGRGLKESRFVILILTMRFIKSGWAMSEYEASLHAEQESGETKVLPLLCTENESEVSQIYDALYLIRSRKFLKWDGNPEAVAMELHRILSEEYLH